MHNIVNQVLDGGIIMNYHMTRTALIRDLFSYGFARKLRAGPYGSYDKSTYSLKVTLAERNGNKIVNATRQSYIVLNESTATVEYITAQMREDFGDSNLTLVTANGLPVEDTDATRGNS